MVELDGDADGEGDAFELKSLYRKAFAPGQDELLNSAPVGDAETVASDKKMRNDFRAFQQRYGAKREKNDFGSFQQWYRAKRAKVAESD